VPVDRNTALVSIDPRVDIGHVHLKVADLDRALDFWHGVLGFDVTARIGDQAAFLSAGGYHYHIGLNTWESKNSAPPSPGTTGLYHLAVRFPDRKTLAEAVKRVLDAGIQLDGASDHGVSEAIYLRDPDRYFATSIYPRPGQVDRIQEVAGSSPASSIASIYREDLTKQSVTEPA
jgi:catechol 2,3-dioxygenase